MRARRMAAGFTQAEFSEYIGVGRRTLTSYESGHVEPPIEMLVRIAHACDVQLSVFVRPLDAVTVPERIPRLVRRKRPIERPPC